MPVHWEFDGTEEKPTIIPEVKCLSCKRVFMIDNGMVIDDK